VGRLSQAAIAVVILAAMYAKSMGTRVEGYTHVVLLTVSMAFNDKTPG
jgi:hypothetical protein